MKELYIAVSGAMAREKELAVLANNLANIHSTSYKRNMVVFEVRPPEVDFESLSKASDPELNLPYPRQQIVGDRNSVRIAETRTDFSMGAVKETTRPLDLAIDEPPHATGASFFRVETLFGERYTRQGNCFLNEDQDLVTGSGFRVLDDSGHPIRLDSSSVDINSAGQILKPDGNRTQIGLIHFDNPDQLDKEGHGLYSDRNGLVRGRSIEPQDRVAVRQGQIEISNVNAIEELVRMIELQRSTSTHQKSIQAIDDASSRSIASALNG